MMMSMLKQFQLLLWKQRVNILRTDLATILVVVLFPSLLLYLSSSGSGVSASKKVEWIPCTVDTFLYCNYPMNVRWVTEEEENDGNNRTKSMEWIEKLQPSFETAAQKTAEAIEGEEDDDFDFNAIFVNDQYAAPSFPFKTGGEITIQNETYATVVWYNGKNNIFPSTFISTLNNQLQNVNNTIRFQQIDNPYEYEGNAGFDLRSATFLLLIQNSAGAVALEKSSSMYYYLTRTGLRPLVFWFFQYFWWMVLAMISIGFVSLTSMLTNKDVSFQLYVVSAWWHVSFGMLIGTIFSTKKYINIVGIVTLLLAFAVPLIFELGLPKQRELYNDIKTVPLFWFSGVEDEDFAIKWGCMITACTMVLSSYLAPLLCVSDGMFVGSKRNFLYFLSSAFWKEGIVATPSHNCDDDPVFEDNPVEEDAYNSGQNNASIEFKDCVKNFGKDKTIGPLNISLNPGTITTLLGPNGVGKTTLLRIAAGYYIPNNGEIILNKSNVFRKSTKSSLSQISFCPQENYLYDHMTVEEHMYLISSLRDMSRIHANSNNNEGKAHAVQTHINWILNTLDITDKRKTLAKNLSGGTKRRLCLALSTIGFPKVMLCDEPSSGVDSTNRRGMWKLLTTAASDKWRSIVLLTTHSALEATILSDSVITMNSSTDIQYGLATEGLTFCKKDVVDNETKEYEISKESLVSLPNVIESLPDDGSEWRIVSKRLANDDLPPLEMVLHKEGDINEADDDDAKNGDGSTKLTTADTTTTVDTTIPETLDCEQPSILRQIYVLLCVVVLHPDRIGFVFVMGIPLSAGMIYVATIYKGLGDMGLLVLTPMIPLIFIIALAILLCNSIFIIAQERDLGVAKLLFGQGISRIAYLLSYFLWYSFISYPVSIATLIAIGSAHGSFSSVFGSICLFTSFWILCFGFCFMLSTILDPSTAFVATMILPSLFSLFAQGALTESFAYSYPGSTGQLMSGLIVDVLKKKDDDWRSLYALTFCVNVVLGLICLYVFFARLGNYNPIKRWWIKRRMGSSSSSSSDVVQEQTTTTTTTTVLQDIENNNHSNVFLEGKNIVKKYGIGANDTASFYALDNVTFGVKSGQMLGLVGKSGAGKSTLMDVLSGQLSVTSGSVLVEGEWVKPTSIATVVSMCGQLDTIWPDMPTRNAIKIFMACRGYKENVYCSKDIKDPYINYLIAKLGMEEMLSKKVKTLSGGQKRRVAFLVSLMGKTKVVLVDEAMTGVDVESRQIMWKILQDEVHFRNRSVVVTSHDISEVEQYCNTVGVLHNGKLVEMGLLNDIKKKWGDSVKLICLFHSTKDYVRELQKTLVQKQPDIIVEDPQIDYIDEDNGQTTVMERRKIVATYTVNLVNYENISHFIITMNENNIGNDTLVYWSIEPQNLDDFVRASSK